MTIMLMIMFVPHPYQWMSKTLLIHIRTVQVYRYEEWLTSSLSRRSRRPLVLAFSYHRVHVCGRVEGHDVPRVTIDTASDVPCIACPFIERHPVLKNEPIHPIPHAAITLKAANG